MVRVGDSLRGDLANLRCAPDNQSLRFLLANRRGRFAGYPLIPGHPRLNRRGPGPANSYDLPAHRGRLQSDGNPGARTQPIDPPT